MKTAGGCMTGGAASERVLGAPGRAGWILWAAGNPSSLYTRPRILF